MALGWGAGLGCVVIVRAIVEQMRVRVVLEDRVQAHFLMGRITRVTIIRTRWLCGCCVLVLLFQVARL